MTTSGVFEAVYDEVNQALTADRPIEHIRVSASALQGWVVVVPVTPERVDELGLTSRDPRELLLHPEDWAELLRERRFHVKRAASYGEFVVGASRSGARTVMGIPVLEGVGPDDEAARG